MLEALASSDSGLDTDAEGFDHLAHHSLGRGPWAPAGGGRGRDEEDARLERDPPTATLWAEGGAFSLRLITQGWLFAEDGSCGADAAGAKRALSQSLSADRQLWLVDCLGQWSSFLRHITAGGLDMAPRHSLAAATRFVADMHHACARLLCSSPAETGGVHGLGAIGGGRVSGAVDVLVAKHLARLVMLAAQALEWLPQHKADSSTTAASRASLFASHATSGAATEKDHTGWATRGERNECKETAMRRCAAVANQGRAPEDSPDAIASTDAAALAAAAEQRIAAYLSAKPGPEGCADVTGAVMQAHYQAPYLMAAAWVRLLLSVSFSVQTDKGGTRRVDRALTLLLAVLAGGAGDAGEKTALVQWQEALHMSLLVAGRGVHLNRFQRGLCAVITAAMPSGSTASTSCAKSEYAGVEELVCDRVLAQWLLSYPFDALPSASIGPSETWGMETSAGRILANCAWLKMLDGKDGLQRCARICRWLLDSGARHGVFSAVVDLLTCQHASMRMDRIERCNLECLCLLTLASHVEGDEQACSQGKGATGGLVDVLRKALLDHDSLQGAAVQVSSWNHSEPDSAQGHGPAARVTQQVETLTLSEVVELVAAQAWVAALARPAQHRSHPTSLQDTAAHAQDTLRQIQHASSYPASFGLLLQHEDVEVRARAVEAAWAMQTNMKLYIQLARHLLTRVSCATEEEAEVMAGIVRHAAASARYYASVATTFWFEWLRQVLSALAAGLVAVVFPDARRHQQAFARGGGDGPSPAQIRSIDSAPAVRLLRLLVEVMQVLPVVDVDAILASCSEIESQAAAGDSASGGPGAVNLQARASGEQIVSPDGDGGGRLVAALASIALDASSHSLADAGMAAGGGDAAANPSPATCPLSSPQATETAITDKRSAVNVAGMYAIKCLCILAASPAPGELWGAGRACSASFQAEHALLQGTLGGGAMAENESIWRVLHNSLLSLAAARTAGCRERYVTAVGAALSQTTPHQVVLLAVLCLVSVFREG